MIQVRHGLLAAGYIGSTVRPVQVKNDEDAICVEQIHPVHDIRLVLCARLARRLSVNAEPAIFV